MGVSSVSIPLLELSQIAHSIRIGGKSHFILLDSSGYLLLHPQLRPFEDFTNKLKFGFNSVEFVDAEVQRPFFTVYLLFFDYFFKLIFLG
jgi:hypothetical protein